MCSIFSLKCFTIEPVGTAIQPKSFISRVIPAPDKFIRGQAAAGIQSPRKGEAGGFPAATPPPFRSENAPRSGQKTGVVPLRGQLFSCLDSRLRGNDVVLF